MNVTIPNYESLILPLLQLSSDGDTHKFSDMADLLADELDLTIEERSEFQPDGTQTIFRSHLGQAKAHMKDAGLLVSPENGLIQITEKGRVTLKTDARRIDDSILGQFADYEDIKTLNTGAPAVSSKDQMASAFKCYQSEIENSLLARVKQAGPSNFKQIVIDLLLTMGYDDSKTETKWSIANQVADKEIDAVIKQGPDIIYIQAKRGDRNVDRPELQMFINALRSKSADTGIYITVSGFSKEAVMLAESTNSKIILIDGDKLARRMVEYNLGVSPGSQYLIKQINAAYFSQ